MVNPLGERESAIERQRRANAPNSATGRRVACLHMASLRKAIAPTVDRILELADDVGLTEERRHDFSVALSEGLSNAAVHGNGLQAEEVVEVRVEVEPGRAVTVDIEDAGDGFDVAAVMDPTGDHTQLLEPNGRGLFLMRKLVDRLEFNDAGNRVRLVMRKKTRRKRS